MTDTGTITRKGLPTICELIGRFGEELRKLNAKRQRRGSPAINTIPRDHRTFVQRFLRHVRHDDEGGCWHWTGGKNQTGHGMFAAYPKRLVGAANVAQDSGLERPC